MNFTRNQVIVSGLASMTVFGIGAGLAYDFALPGMCFVFGGISIVSLFVATIRYLGLD